MTYYILGDTNRLSPEEKHQQKTLAVNSDNFSVVQRQLASGGGQGWI